MRIIQQIVGRFPLGRGLMQVQFGVCFVLKVDRACRYDGGNGVFVNHLGYGSVSQENNVLIERLNLTLQFDTVN